MLQALSSVGLRGPVFVLRRRRNSCRCLCVKEAFAKAASKLSL
jgi:hypothetical protein